MAHETTASPSGDRTEYVRALLEYTRDDARQAYLGVTGTLAVATLFVTQLPFARLQALDRSWTFAFFIGLGALVAAAALFFVYASDVHHARRRIARSLLELDGADAKRPDQILDEVLKRRNTWVLWPAKILSAIGLLLLGAVLWEMVTATGPSRSAVATPRRLAAASFVTTAKTQLGKLAVKPAGTMTGYSREKFGAPWADVDHNGCDTRDDILTRDMTEVALKPGSSCLVKTGVLADPYTGKTIHFVRGVKTSTAVQIDHVVALGNVWRTGAAAWTAPKRLGYANDPVVLLAVDGPANEAKGDSDASEWLPPRKAERCKYVAQQITIKTKYRLWVTPAERSAMASVLKSCS